MQNRKSYSSQYENIYNHVNNESLSKIKINEKNIYNFVTSVSRSRYIILYKYFKIVYFFSIIHNEITQIIYNYFHLKSYKLKFIDNALLFYYQIINKRGDDKNNLIKIYNFGNFILTL